MSAGQAKGSRPTPGHQPPPLVMKSLRYSSCSEVRFTLRLKSIAPSITGGPLQEQSLTVVHLIVDGNPSTDESR